MMQGRQLQQLTSSAERVLDMQFQKRFLFVIGSIFFCMLLLGIGASIVYSQFFAPKHLHPGPIPYNRHTTNLPAGWYQFSDGHYFLLTIPDTWQVTLLNGQESTGKQNGSTETFPITIYSFSTSSSRIDPNMSIVIAITPISTQFQHDIACKAHHMTNTTLAGLAAYHFAGGTSWEIDTQTALLQLNYRFVSFRKLRNTSSLLDLILNTLKLNAPEMLKCL